MWIKSVSWWQTDRIAVSVSSSAYSCGMPMRDKKNRGVERQRKVERFSGAGIDRHVTTRNPPYVAMRSRRDRCPRGARLQMSAAFHPSPPGTGRPASDGPTDGRTPWSAGEPRGEFKALETNCGVLNPFRTVELATVMIAFIVDYRW